MKNTDNVVAQAMLWPELFGPNQEAFVTLSDVHINFNEMQLTLKAQDPSTSCHSISVLYAPSSGTVQVWVCDNTWVMKGSTTSLFAAGDRLGARAYANGTIEVFRNDQLIATHSLAGWPGNSNVGMIGLSADIEGMVESFDDFGGGTFECPGGG